jgi:hypothetical protein
MTWKEGDRMFPQELWSVRAVLAVGVVLAELAGCASDPRYQQGVDWVVWQEAEKKRLDDAGFPQYNGSP